jgi:hypothetical protein
MKPQLSIPKTLIFIFIALIASLMFSCKQLYIDPLPEPVYMKLDKGDTAIVKFTLYSNRVPYIWKRRVNGAWVEDTIKVNAVYRYESYDKLNLGYGYWVTMNLSGKPTDSLSIKAVCRGKETQMSSPKGQSAAYVLLNNLK